MDDQPSVAVIGGGLSGLAASTLLCEAGCRVELFESRRILGGRAGSYQDPATGRWIDHCQHVAMGCCTYFIDFLQRNGVKKHLQSDRTLHFFDLQGRHTPLTPARLLPAPLHLSPFLARLPYLTWAERWRVATALSRLARQQPDTVAGEPTVGQWLAQQRQSPDAIERFWKPVLVSALSESLDRASLTAARQVFCDGFMAHHDACELLLPSIPLAELYDQLLAAHLLQQGLQIHRGTPVQQVERTPRGQLQIQLAHDQRRFFDLVIVAVPWRHITRLIAGSTLAALPQLAHVERIESAPITSLHLWFDRPIMDLPHAVLLERLAQWIFRRGAMATSIGASAHYYQVVISAARHISKFDSNELVERVVEELRALWPQAAAATLVKSQLVTQRDAVFSVVPEMSQLRPAQRTPVEGLFLAGDWTDTGWPATMEGAVRSGYQAAWAALESMGRPIGDRVAELPRSWLFRLLAGRRDTTP